MPESVLREGPTRRVVRVRRGDERLVMRTLTASRVPRHFARVVRHAVLDGRGSFASLGDEIAMTLEGYAAAARLLPDPGNPPRWSRPVDAGVDDDGHAFVVTTWIDGVPLNRLPAPLSVDARTSATLELLDVLVALHDQRVAHGDLKLANLILRPDGGLALIDLDTLREVPSPDVGAPTRDRTEAWAAPEQLQRHETWLGSDLWALARVLRELWGAELPEAWRAPLAACRAPEPADRPTIRSFREALQSGGTVFTCHGLPCGPVAEEPASPPVVGGPTERVAAAGGATERVGPTVTERVAEVAPGPGEGPPTRGPAPPPTPAPRSLPARRSGGCMGLLELAGKGAVAVAAGAALLMCGGLLGWGVYSQHAADLQAEKLLVDAKIHKTDPEKNGASVRDDLHRRAAALVDETKTARTCAVHALTLVWQQRWHFDDRWSQADFDEASVAVNDPVCRHEVEAQLARATLYAGACRRRDPSVATVADCQLALDAIDSFWAAVPAGDEAAWLRVEGAWQEVRARSALVGRYVQTGNAESGAQSRAALARCAAAEPWAGFAPVNAPELWEECMVVAGLTYEVDPYLHYTDLRLGTLGTEARARRRVLEHLFVSAGPECRETKIAWKKSRMQVGGDPWCVALGHAARRCAPDAEAALRDVATLDTVHPWGALASSATARGSTCLQ